MTTTKATEAPLGGRDERQSTVARWTRETLGDATMTSGERALRFFEEACELAQAEGLTTEQCAALVAHVFGKPAGDPAQEVGGVSVTLLAYCEARGFSADAAEARELARVLAIDPQRFREDRKSVV